MAFLPSASAAHLVAETAWATFGFTRSELGSVVYDFEALARLGMQSFDRTIFELAGRTGRVLRASEGDLVRSTQGTMFRADEQRFVLCEARLPDGSVVGWRAGKARFDARATAKVFAAITAIPAIIGAVAGAVAFVRGESLPMIFVGVGFWWTLVLFGWVGYFVAYRRSQRTP